MAVSQKDAQPLRKRKFESKILQKSKKLDKCLSGHIF